MISKKDGLLGKPVLKGFYILLDAYKMFLAPIGYDGYLFQLYGHEYMQLSPVCQRQTHHAYKAY